MNLAPPSWLRADWLVWMCLWLRLWMLHTVFDLCAKRAVNRRFAEGDLNLIGPFLAEAEAELAWAIARRVRRLAGRPVYCPRVLPACPKRQGAFIRRYRQIHVDCLFIDRRVAKRLRRLQRARAAVP
ncbi:MAG: hypothetical protein GC155_03935, partial [Alphaproteobacteria bacterium]|nr:hypothetical protein [Alphaproteobacteria bacterium]